MRLIDVNWLDEHLNLYAFNSRDDIRKFINDAPVIDVYTADDMNECRDKALKEGYNKGWCESFQHIDEYINKRKRCLVG